MASLRLVKSFARCLCCISSVFLVIQSIEKCSSVSFHCLHNVEEVKSFVLVKLPGGGQFYGKRLRLPRVHNIYTEESILLSYTPVEGRIVKS